VPGDEIAPADGRASDGDLLDVFVLISGFAGSTSTALGSGETSSVALAR